jgi:hypothetical protein
MSDITTEGYNGQNAPDCKPGDPGEPKPTSKPRPRPNLKPVSVG